MSTHGTPVDNHRQEIILNLAGKLIANKHSEREALSLFLWKLSAMEPPVTVLEQLSFCAHFRMLRAYSNTSVENMEKALEILNLTGQNTTSYPAGELFRIAKTAYWKQYNDLTGTINQLLTHAHVLGAKKKAFDFLCQACCRR